MWVRSAASGLPATPLLPRAAPLAMSAATASTPSMTPAPSRSRVRLRALRLNIWLWLAAVVVARLQLQVILEPVAVVALVVIGVQFLVRIPVAALLLNHLFQLPLRLTR